MTDLPSVRSARKIFIKACQALNIDRPTDVRNLTIYEMTDGMRTSTDLRGGDAYFDGGLFALRFIHMLKSVNATSCYVNVIEERHKGRKNYASIYAGLRRLYPVYRKYALDNDVQLRFLGDLNEKLEPTGASGRFAADLALLEEETCGGKSFTAFFLVNYSLDWAMNHAEELKDLPRVNQIIRHTKLQLPTGMLLPPFLSDYSSCVYVQQGSSSKTWSDVQLSDLIAIALRSMILNHGTQYLKKYTPAEVSEIKVEREEKLYLVHKKLVERRGRNLLDRRHRSKSKRAIITGPFGPEIYEF